jgi:uncharacterized membrane protein
LWIVLLAGKLSRSLEGDRADDGMNGLLEELSASPGVLHSDLPGLVHGLEWVSAAIDLASVAIMLIGALRFILGFVKAEVARPGQPRVRAIDWHRMELGRYILSALELLIVSDIIHTALSLALADLIFLGLLVLIRSMISLFLNREIRELSGEIDT